MSGPSKSSKLCWNLLVRGRLLHRVSNNFDSVFNGSLYASGSSNFIGLLGTQQRNFRTQMLYFGTHNRNPFQRNEVHEACFSQFSYRLVQRGIRTEAKNGLDEDSSGDVTEDDVENQNFGGSDAQEGNISETSRTINAGSPYKVYVGNLPAMLNIKALLELFSPYGNLLDARVFFENKKEKSHIFGFITFSSQAEVEAAIAALHGKKFHRRTLVVSQGKNKNQIEALSTTLVVSEDKEKNQIQALSSIWKRRS
uniref:RRM domain-containing protein n=1 Tax=Araucaria cunninghamii TaxID=56994 RepID=A0A0D6R0A0_ARACU